jgi:hypothetical protein
MKTLPPTKGDLAQIDLAIRSFPNAWGCVRRDGSFMPGILDPTLLWMMIGSTDAQMAALWRLAGMKTDSKSSYAAMLAAKQHHVTLMFSKVRKSLFRSAWVGNVSMDFDKINVCAGSVAGRTQADMWRQLRAFVEADGKLYPSTTAAFDAI